MIPSSKICGFCGVEKIAADFSIRKKPNGYQWLRMECRECENAKRKEKYATDESYRKRVIERNALYDKKNYEKISERNRKWRKKNEKHRKEQQRLKYINKSEEIKAKRKEYYYKNKEKVIAINSNYVKRNKDVVRARQRANHKKRKRCDSGYSILKILRSRVSAAIKKKGKKCYRTRALVGCNMDVLLRHLESGFAEGMSWQTYGLRGWHVDHIIPCDAFDLSKPEEQLKCFHYTNLQPLWWYDNLKKSNKVA